MTMEWVLGNIIRYSGSDPDLRTMNWLVLGMHGEDYFCDRWCLNLWNGWYGKMVKRTLQKRYGYILCESSEIPPEPSPLWKGDIWPPVGYRKREPTFCDRLEASLASALKRKPDGMPDKCFRCDSPMSAYLDIYHGSTTTMVTVDSLDDPQKLRVNPSRLCSSCRPRGS